MHMHNDFINPLFGRYNGTPCTELHNVFVYGTLMEGLHNHYLLKDKDTELCGEGIITGFKMYDKGAYPCIIPDKGAIFGELYKVNKQILKTLDCLEIGYTRKLVKATVKTGGIKAGITSWVYIYDGVVINSPYICSGNWADYRTAKTSANPIIRRCYP